LYKFILVLCLSLVTACATTQPPPPVEQKPRTIKLLKSSSSRDKSLNVSIVAFSTKNSTDSGSSRKSQFVSRLKSSESSYLPVLLQKTLVESAHWGAVRVLPETDPTAEILVTAEILDSTALELSLKIQIKDSRGVVWVDQIYSDLATEKDYQFNQGILAEPFQDLYNEIANDMSAMQNSLSEREVSNILDIATLNYAIALSPRSFSQHLETNKKGIAELSRLPASNDPMYTRVRNIRDSEYLFIDTMHEKFAEFFNRMQRVYPYWRKYSYELDVYNARLKQTGSKHSRKANGKWQAFEDVYKTYKEYKLNEDELNELGDSFESEITPTVTGLEGNVIELSGSLATQYEEWRNILQEIYAVETDQYQSDPGKTGN